MLFNCEGANRKAFIVIMSIVTLVLGYRISILITHEMKPARVLGCSSKSFWDSERRTHTKQYAPYAVSEDGHMGYGWPLIKGYKNCSDMIGKKTSILVHPENHRKNKIHSFIDFWAVWSFPLFFCGFFLTSYFNLSARATLTYFFGYVVAVPLLIAYELRAYEKYLGVLYSDKQEVSQAALKLLSKNMLQSCINEGLAKRGIKIREEEITHFSCSSRFISDLSGIAHLDKLEILLEGSNKLTSLQSLGHRPTLKSLSISGNYGMKSLDGIENAPNLEELFASGMNLVDITAISDLTSLKEISLSQNPISDISALSHLDNLEEVYLNHTQFSSISALKDKPALSSVTLQGHMNKVYDISPLFTSPKLTYVRMTGASDLPCHQIKTLERLLQPDAKIEVYSPHCD